MTALLLTLVGVLGVAVGSFLNVVIWRVPRGESVVSPPSHCPGCDSPILRRDNVPVLSWLLLRGRCRGCRSPISPRYPLVELLTGAVFVGTGLRFGVTLELVAFLYLAAVGVALAAIDLDVHRLPNAIVLPSYAVVGGLLTLTAAVEDRWPDLLRALAGMAALYLFYFLLALIKPGAMGFGDVKLAGVLGLALGWLGWGPLAVGAFLGFLLGGSGGVLLILAGRAGRRSHVPFGPFMLAGAALGVVCGAAITSSYIGLVSA